MLARIGLWGTTNRKRSHEEWRRRLKFTREGKFFVGITLGVGFAAVNTGNNLLYLLLGLLLSLIVVSGVMSELSLKKLTVVRRLPPRAQVGRPHLVEIEVFNHKRRVPSYAIEVEDLRAGQPADKRCFFLKISPKSAQVAAYRRTPTRRGRDTHVGFRLATRFPFGLFEKSREVPAKGDLLIYPAVDSVQLPPPGRGHQLGADYTYYRGHGEELLGVRLLREGEDVRDVHWKKTAALGSMVGRDRARDAQPDVTLRLDVQRPADARDDWNQGFERRIREVASRAVAHVKRGDTVTLLTNGAGASRATRAVGADPLLRFLALVQPVAPTDAHALYSPTPPAYPSGRVSPSDPVSGRTSSTGPTTPRPEVSVGGMDAADGRTSLDDLASTTTTAAEGSSRGSEPV